MDRHETDAMTAEFDTVAAWTEAAITELGPEYAVIAGCRGSGSPANLAWLAEALEVQRATRMLDAGSGVGGPAAWLEQRFGVRPYCVEPMPAAAGACQRLFNLPTAIGLAEHLPFADESFDAAWALGVLCTTPNKLDVLNELRRVLTINGQLGLLVFVADDLPADQVPEGNFFPAESELRSLLPHAGFAIMQVLSAQELGTAPIAWQTRADRVEASIAARHAESPAWRLADEQSQHLAALLDTGAVRAVLVHSVAT